jgi:chorismate-pyruvate lyase
LFTVPDLPVFLLPALEEQLVASHHEMEEAHLREVLLMEDHEPMVVAGIQ